MAFIDCIRNGLKDGDLTPDQAKQVEDILNERKEALKLKMGEAQAEQQAAKDALDILTRSAEIKKRNMLMSKAAAADISKKLFGENGYKGGKDPSLAAQALFAKDPNAKYPDMEYRQRSIFGQLQSQMVDVLATFRRKGPIGLYGNINVLHDVIYEVWGKDTGNQAAKEMAQAWIKTGEMARDLFNKAGGNIAKLDIWRLPQNHNMIAVTKAGREAWIKFVTPLLDLGMMKNEITGKTFTASELREALEEVYKTITNHGYNKIKPSGTLYTNHRSVSKRYMDHRFLLFKNPEDWIKYQESFGNPDTFATMNQYLHKMSHDIAMMQVLGPNPHAMMNFIRQSVLKDAAELDVMKNELKIVGKKETLGEKIKGSEVSRAQRNLEKMDELFEVYNGSSYASADHWAAQSLQALRNINNAAFLGGTVLTSLGDLGTQKATIEHLGMQSKPLLKRILSNLNPLNVEERGKLALRSGIIMESWIGLAQAQARFAGDITGPEISQRISDIVMRVTGLSPWTQAGRISFGLEVMGNMSDLVGKNFSELNPKLQSALTRYGFDSTSWDLIRKSEVYNHEGATFLRPEDIRLAKHMPEDQAQDLAFRYLDMINTEIEKAVPTVGIRAKATLQGGTKAGTIPGELMRSFGMYKNFAVQMVYSHLWTAISEPTVAKKSAYIANLAISTTIMAALAMQLKEISKGRDPRSMDTKEFWGAALLQGGGLGIFGDFLGSNVNRYGGGLSDTVAGPVVNFINDSINLTWGNAKQYIQGEDTNFAGEALKMIETYLPGKSIWYMNLLFQREMFEQLQLWANPKYQEKLNRLQNKYLRETGQEYWWRPGQLTPDRAPEISSETLLTK